MNNPIKYERFGIGEPKTTNEKIETLGFMSRNDAMRVLNFMFREADLFKRTSVYTLFAATMTDTTDEDKALGWTRDELNSAKIVAKRGKGWSLYVIQFPEAHEIDPLPDFEVGSLCYI